MRGIVAVVVLVGATLIIALVARIALIVVDVNHDWARREHSAQLNDVHRGIWRAIYNWLWRRKLRHHGELEERQRKAWVKWGNGGDGR